MLTIVLDLHCCTWAFSSCGKWGLLIAMVSFVVSTGSRVLRL